MSELNKQFGSLLLESPYQLFSNCLREVLTRNIIKIPARPLVEYFVCDFLYISSTGLKALNMFHMIKELKTVCSKGNFTNMTGANFWYIFWGKDY
jgi:hypothetical protein